MAKRITIKEVAVKAGVSYQTVSKVINNKGHVSKETEERIWKVVEDLNYKPHHSARSLRSRRTQMIGYSWEPSPRDQANPILDQFLQSMLLAAEKVDHYLLFFPYHAALEQVNGYRSLVDSGRIDGFVLSSVENNDPRIAYLKDRNIPFVAFGRSNPEWEFPYVDVDGSFGMRLVTEHLIGLGHRRIAALAWSQVSRVGQDRLSGYTAAMTEAGLPIANEWIQRGEGRFSYGFQAASRLMELPNGKRPTAIVALNDPMAVGAIHAANEKNLQVGVDVAITGFDDAPMTQYIVPSLTTIRQPIWEIGQRVIEILTGILNGNQPKDFQVLLPPKLILRDSSGGSLSEP